MPKIPHVSSQSIRKILKLFRFPHISTVFDMDFHVDFKWKKIPDDCQVIFYRQLKYQRLLKLASSFSCIQQAPISLCIESSSDNAISINSYDELIIGLFQGFLSSKQSIDTNHVISTWEGRPPSRAKSTIEVQYSQFHMQRKENCY
ncbi:hypothetical protein RIR_jg22938.t1 [Rhizophagus irregularis DAOM 181602=DAOM 197198]|nr:hypothetical protein RIR_jg22938.t1 [Rhizophagus irregularis DAOM 181602=DAOM 197198]